MAKPLVFVSYSREDHVEKRDLVAHLSVLGYNDIDLWVDDRLSGGEEWERTILEQIDRAHVAVLLVTENFLNSEFIRRTELPAIRRRWEAGGLTVFPVIGKACAWHCVGFLTSLNVRPHGGKPVWAGDSQLSREYLAAIADEITALVQRSQGSHSSAPPEARREPEVGDREPEVADREPNVADREPEVADREPAIEYEPDTVRQELLEILRRFSAGLETAATERLFGTEAVEGWRLRTQHICARLDDEFNLTVIGPFKRGKSTLINALLREEVVTADIGPETVTINEIRYGPRRTVEAHVADGGRVRLTSGQLKREELERVLARVPQAVTHIDVRAPIDSLRGLCLVDTPGTGDLMQRFDRTVQSYLATTDAVLFVLSPLEPLSETERAFLQLAVFPQDFAKLTFVVNMLDRVRDEADEGRVMEYLQRKIERLFPGAVVLGVSALDELSRVSGAPPPVPRRHESMSSRFDALRIHLQESILDNRDVIQIDRAAAELSRLLKSVAQHAEHIRWATGSDQQRVNDTIHAYEDGESPWHARRAQRADDLRSFVKTLGQEAHEWLGVFLDRLEETGSRLAGFTGEDLKRHFPFFLADALRIAMHRCFDAHRLLILAQFHLAPSPTVDAATVATVATVAIDESDLARRAGEATAGDSVWDRLELSKMLFEVVQSEVFGIVTGLLRQLDASEHDREQSLLYEKQFLDVFQSLRRSVLNQTDELYAAIAERLVKDMERHQQESVDMSLRALRQGQRMSAERDRAQETFDHVTSLVTSTEEAVDRLRPKLSQLPMDSLTPVSGLLRI